MKIRCEKGMERMDMEIWGSGSGERQQGVCELPKGEGTTPSPVLPGFPCISDQPFPLPLPGLGNTRKGSAEPRTPSLGTADTKKKFRILHPAAPAG